MKFTLKLISLPTFFRPEYQYFAKFQKVLEISKNNLQNRISNLAKNYVSATLNEILSGFIGLHTQNASRISITRKISQKLKNIK